MNGGIHDAINLVAGSPGFGGRDRRQNLSGSTASGGWSRSKPSRSDDPEQEEPEIAGRRIPRQPVRDRRRSGEDARISAAGVDDPEPATRGGVGLAVAIHFGSTLCPQPNTTFTKSCRSVSFDTRSCTAEGADFSLSSSATAPEAPVNIESRFCASPRPPVWSGDLAMANFPKSKCRPLRQGRATAACANRSAARRCGWRASCRGQEPDYDHQDLECPEMRYNEATSGLVDALVTRRSALRRRRLRPRVGAGRRGSQGVVVFHVTNQPASCTLTSRAGCGDPGRADPVTSKP